MASSKTRPLLLSIASASVHSSVIPTALPRTPAACRKIYGSGFPVVFPATSSAQTMFPWKQSKSCLRFSDFRRKFHREDAVATTIGTSCFAKCWTSFCTPGRGCTVGHRASNFSWDSTRYSSIVMSMLGKQESRYVADSSRTAAWFQLKLAGKISDQRSYICP